MPTTPPQPPPPPRGPSTLAERLRCCADSYESAHKLVSPYGRIKALREARSELFAIGIEARAELDRLILMTPPRAQTRAIRALWYDLLPDQNAVRYWRKFTQLKHQSVITLGKLGIASLDALEALSRNQLRRTPFVGRNTLREIEDVLMDHGRVFKGTGSKPLEPPKALMEQALARQGAAE